MKRNLIIVAVALGILFAMPLTNNGVLATDHSRKYYVIFGGEPNYTMNILQRGLDLTFTLIGGDIAVSGSGTLNGNKMTLMAKLPMGGSIQTLSTLKILAIFSSDDGPVKRITFDPEPSSYGYPAEPNYDKSTAKIFGEWECLPAGGVYLGPSNYTCQIILTEESFQGRGADLVAVCRLC